jgi:hypothetical protein
MAVQTLTAPPQTYPAGITWWQKALPGDQTYSHFEITVDFTGWTSLATSKIEVRVQLSFNGGSTWRDLFGFMQETLPPWDGSSITHAIRDSPTAGNPTHVRGGIRVTGAAVALGTLTLEAS